MRQAHGVGGGVGFAHAAIEIERSDGQRAGFDEAGQHGVGLLQLTLRALAVGALDSETLVGVEQFAGAQLDAAIEVVVRGAEFFFGLAAKQIDAENFRSADPDDRQGAQDID